MKLHYTDRHRLPESVEKELGLTFHPNAESMVKVCDVVTINCPLHPETEHLFNEAMIAKMKRGAYLVNTARGKICDRDAIVRALGKRATRRLCRRRVVSAASPAGPPVAHHAAPRHDAPHLRLQPLRPGRYAAGTREILECWFEGRPIRNEYLIVDGRQTGRRGRPFLQRRQRHGRVGGSREVQAGVGRRFPVGGRPRPQKAAINSRRRLRRYLFNPCETERAESAYMQPAEIELPPFR